MGSSDWLRLRPRTALPLSDEWVGRDHGPAPSLSWASALRWHPGRRPGPSARHPGPAWLAVDALSFVARQLAEPFLHRSSGLADCALGVLFRHAGAGPCGAVRGAVAPFRASRARRIGIRLPPRPSARHSSPISRRTSRRSWPSTLPGIAPGGERRAASQAGAPKGNAPDPHRSLRDQGPNAASFRLLAPPPEP